HLVPREAPIDLQKLNRCPTVLNKGNHDPGARAVRRNDYVLALDRFRKIVDLEGDVRNGLDQRRIRGVVLVACPFDAIGISPVAADVQFEMLEMDLVLQLLGGWDAEVVVLHASVPFSTLSGRTDLDRGP